MKRLLERLWPFVLRSTCEARLDAKEEELLAAEKMLQGMEDVIDQRVQELTKAKARNAELDQKIEESERKCIMYQRVMEDHVCRKFGPLVEFRTVPPTLLGCVMVKPAKVRLENDSMYETKSVEFKTISANISYAAEDPLPPEHYARKIGEYVRDCILKEGQKSSLLNEKKA